MVSSNYEPTLVTANDYARAVRFFPRNKDGHVANADPQHSWISNEDRFWFLRTNEAG